jgi:hypothetical protein
VEIVGSNSAGKGNDSERGVGGPVHSAFRSVRLPLNAGLQVARRSRIPRFLTLPGSHRPPPTFIFSYCWHRYYIWPSDQRNLGSFCEKLGRPPASCSLFFEGFASS